MNEKKSINTCKKPALQLTTPTFSKFSSFHFSLFWFFSQIKKKIYVKTIFFIFNIYGTIKTSLKANGFLMGVENYVFRRDILT